MNVPGEGEECWKSVRCLVRWLGGLREDEVLIESAERRIQMLVPILGSMQRSG
jgi:hypothetical protein